MEVYLDNNSTTPIDPRVLEAMLPFFRENFANPSSVHKKGVAVKNAINHARQQVAGIIGANTNNIIFTSGATEANNLAIKSVSESLKSKGQHIITVETEHPSVLESFRQLEAIGYEVTYLPVQKTGLVDIKVLKQNLRSDTVLVSIMLVNNETGVIQPLQEISKISRESGALVMTDATQALGKLAIDVFELDVDLLTFSAHKFNGPKGIGALYVRNPKLIKPLLHGGGQEHGHRSGTLNVPAIVGFGKACEIASIEQAVDSERIAQLRDKLEQSLLKIETTFVNGSRNSRVCNVSNVFFGNIDTDVIVSSLNDIFVSNGSACSSALVQASHVLKSMGLTDEEAFASIRFSVGKYNTMEEIIYAIKRMEEAIVEQRVLKTTDLKI